MAKEHSVYILISKGKAVYIGCSCNVLNRLSKHRKDKEFDSHIVLKTYKSKKEALIAENSIIRFLNLFGDGDWYNSENILLSHERDTMIRYDEILIKSN